jgi:hypothetical protein
MTILAWSDGLRSPSSPAVQPRVGGPHGRGKFNSDVGDMARGLTDGAQGEARLRPGEVPQPQHQARPAPGGRSSPVPAMDYIVRPRLPLFPTGYIDGLKQQYKAHSGKFCSGLFDVLTGHGQALAVPHAGAQPGAQHRGQALLLRQRPTPAQAR